MAARDVPIEIDRLDGRLYPIRFRQPARQLCAPAAPDKLAPKRRATLPVARQRRRPDAGSVFGGEVSWHPSLNTGDGRLRPYSGLMFAARITLPHFSVSSARSLAKSEDEPVNISLANSAIRAFTVGSARAALTSRLIRSTIPVGVPLGTPIPSQPVTS